MAAGPTTQFTWTAVYDAATKRVTVNVTAVVTPPIINGSDVQPGPVWTGNIKTQISQTPDFSDIDFEYTCSPPAKTVILSSTYFPDNAIVYVRVAGSLAAPNYWTEWSAAKVIVTPTATWVNVGGINKPVSAIFVKVNGTWVQAIRFVKESSAWKA